jgi:hypothetical protein
MDVLVHVGVLQSWMCGSCYGMFVSTIDKCQNENKYLIHNTNIDFL